MRLRFRNKNYYISSRWEPSEGWFGFNHSGTEQPSQTTGDLYFEYYMFSFFGFLIGLGRGEPFD